MPNTYSTYYLEGIRDGREWVRQYGADLLDEHISATAATAKKFDAQSPVGQLLRGELEFLRNYRKKHG